ncbi:MAG: hypothetical protein EOO77_24230 [Oxalobacteraceae bacterium]|jgi:hypothetical protein|nr:MAG: hypothetical protein EOO77_24230 [Oxalobacteraceae bacterium]
MQTIGAFKLRNNGGFVCAPLAIWIDESGGTQKTGNGGHIALGQGEMFNPGDHGVTPQSLVQLGIWIAAGDDRTGGTYFLYDPSSKQYAEYDITGTTYNSNVHFDGVKSN